MDNLNTSPLPPLTCQPNNFMKLKLISLLLSLTGCSSYGQGVVIDQQSTNLIEGAAFLQSGQPMGQSFTPTLSSVGFVLLNLYDGDVFNNTGGTVYVNLRSNSITGAILSSSTAVFMPHDFFGITNFFFSTPVAVAPGTTYYLQPVAQLGSDGFGSYVTDGSYARGSEIYQGGSVVGQNLWFQEGILGVPEPSPIWLAWLGGAAWLLVRRHCQ